MKDELSLEARFYDDVWGQSDYDADVRFLDELLRKNYHRSLIDIGRAREFQKREHKLRWFQTLTLRKLLSESGFKVTGQYSGPSMEELDEEKHVNMWFVTVAD